MRQDSRTSGKKAEMTKKIRNLLTICFTCIIWDNIKMIFRNFQTFFTKQLSTCVKICSVPFVSVIFTLRFDQGFNPAVPHRSKRMIFHRTLIERHSIHIQFSTSYDSTVYRKGRTQDGACFPKIFHNCICNRTDIPLFCRVESGAVFKIEFLGPLVFQPLNCFQSAVYSNIGRFRA